MRVQVDENTCTYRAVSPCWNCVCSDAGSHVTREAPRNTACFACTHDAALGVLEEIRADDDADRQADADVDAATNVVA